MVNLPDELAALIRFPAELRAVEYKRELDWGSADHRVKLTRTAMALSNLQDGGYIVIGVAEKPKGTFTSVGLSEEAVAALNPDDISEFVNKYADPPVLLEVRSGEVDRKRFCIVSVRPFVEVPTVCKQTGGASGELRSGAVYVRSIRKRETALVSSQDEMRELIDRAVDMQIEKLRRRLPGSFGERPPQREQREDLNIELGPFL